MKKMLIAGNWKMNTMVSESIKLAKEILLGIGGKKYTINILLCPPFTSLYSVKEEISNSQLLLGAQNCFYQSHGAYTGEISVPMLKHIGCSHIITGHSERRTIFAETNNVINKKIKAILSNNLIPIICIGETLEERNQNLTFRILEKQINECLQDISKDYSKRLVIAYEPVWAIGTGIVATRDQINEAHIFIREKLYEMFSKESESICIQYGGSVNDENAEEILSLPDVNGALIGGASLKAKSFINIINIAQEIAS